MLATLLRVFTATYGLVFPPFPACFPADGDSNFGFAVNPTDLIAIDSDETVIQ